MRNLDETDIEILSLLAADARRPFSEISEAVGLSGPAVSDRVDRLVESGVINRFTVDIDRAQLRAGVPVLIQVELPAGALSEARERARTTDDVEHVFVTAAGDLWLYARVDGQSVRDWMLNLFEDSDIDDYSVTLVDESEWVPSVEGTTFALTCAECNNTVDSEGETAHIRGNVYHFCCPSCLARFEERYQRLDEQS